MAFLEKLSGKKRNIILAVLGALGVLLILIGILGEKNDEKNPEISEKTNDTWSYIAEIENKIGNITEQITGSHRVEVIVNVSSGSEFQYIQNVEEKDSTQLKEYVTVRGDDKETAILQKEIYPEIVGISVACKGGEDPLIAEKLIRVIATAYGLSSNRICIVGLP